MKYKFLTLIITAMTITNSSTAQQLDFSKVKTYEHQLDDVMEIIDTTELKVKLKEVEREFQQEPNEINKVRLGIIYHETALNLSFFSKTQYKGYAQKSFDKLSELFDSPKTTKELMPFVASFRASALSLVGAESKKLKYIGKAFSLFKETVANYSAISYLPEYLRGSFAENLPWFFFGKRRVAKNDFQSIIYKQEKNADFANWKIMSFTYWAWSKQHQGKKYRNQAISYLDKAISLDPNYKAGRTKAEALKLTLTK
jgi:tetratricopeptide (TPR) repeat protein